jgi:hypothetical protein
MMVLARHLDTAIAAVDRTADDLRHADLEPADLAVVVAGMRELFWHLDDLTARLAAAYSDLGDVGHDHGSDPVAAVGDVIGDVTAVRQHLAGIDDRLGRGLPMFVPASPAAALTAFGCPRS